MKKSCAAKTIVKTSLLRFCCFSPFIFLLLVAKSEAGGPSFDCPKARSWSEQCICQDAELISLDWEISGGKLL